MGRPWWYDSYWERNREPIRRFKLPRRPIFVWAVVLLLSLLFTAISTGFYPSAIPWFLGFISYLCRILAWVIFLRVLLSWFRISQYNRLIVMLDDIVQPILKPLRRVVPRLGIFDVTPLIAFAILYVIPLIFRVVLL